ncbi:hypothetical protein GCM10023196_105550 [Actinoallomurus vinaceus]|uniref:Uncharacterized protein n=1 Tax=Actinoallomurus vinaceus TaxID=1080074 RepID=A0ABP8UUA1_9ACTN
MAVTGHTVHVSAATDLPPVESRVSRLLEALRRSVALLLGPDAPLHEGDDSHGLSHDGDLDELW